MDRQVGDPCVVCGNPTPVGYRKNWPRKTCSQACYRETRKVLKGRTGPDHPTFGKSNPSVSARMREYTGEKNHMFGRTGPAHHSFGKPRPDAAARTGPKNPMWTGDAATYEAAHLRLRKALGKPTVCHACLTTAPDKRYEWAFTGGAPGEYSLDPEDYVRLCRQCHFWFDDRELRNDYQQERNS